jgi:hypothetical protein
LKKYPLTFKEQQVIALVCVNQYVYINGRRGNICRGHCINFSQDILEVATILPRLGSEIYVIIMRKISSDTLKNFDLRVRREYVSVWFNWLKKHGSEKYRNVFIDKSRILN